MNNRARWILYLPLACFIIVGIAVGSYVWAAESIEIRWAAIAVAITLILVGLGVQGFLIARYVDKKLAELSQTLIRLETLQNEIKAEQEKQKRTGRRARKRAERSGGKGLPAATGTGPDSRYCRVSPDECAEVKETG